jgi:hypothetical protein
LIEVRTPTIRERSVVVIVTVATLLFFVFSSIYLSQTTYATHLPGKKFAVLNPNTELRGIVAGANPDNGELYILPDPNYQSLLLPGNTHAAQPSDNIYSNWKSYQDNIDNCRSLPYYYSKPYSIINLELYGFDGYDSGPGPTDNQKLPLVTDNGVTRSVMKCDHILVRGLYVIDHGHTMYGSYTGSFESRRGPWLTGLLHAELHPYTWSSVRLIDSPKPGEPYSESHTLVVPYYYQAYKDLDLAKRFGQTGPVDDTRKNSNHADWNIANPPQPIRGCYGGCQLDVRENIISKQGIVKVTIGKESTFVAIHVDVEAIQPPPPFEFVHISDYVPKGNFNGCLSDQTHRDTDSHTDCIYTIRLPSLYDATFTLKWIPRQPTPVEDCIHFDPNQASVKNMEGRWKVVVGNMWMLDFGNSQANAQKAVDIIKYYGFTDQCFVGRPNAPMMYFVK